MAEAPESPRAVFPIAATGKLRPHGRALKFLQMVQRKIYWLTHHAQKLIEAGRGLSSMPWGEIDKPNQNTNNSLGPTARGPLDILHLAL